MLALAGLPAAAQTIPLPTPRPSTFGRAAPTPPATTRSVPVTPEQEAHPQEFGGGLSHEQFRVRMRSCALKWTSLQQDGGKHDTIWRDFASVCLRADPAG